jgi:hypothetical protein
MPRSNLQFASLIIDRVKKAYKMSSDAELADFLEIAPSTVSSWRRRNTVDLQLVFAKCNEICADYLIHGDMPIYRNEKSSDYPSAKSGPVEEPANSYSESQTIAEYERRMNELAEKIERGPFSKGLKIRLIDMLVSIIGDELDELQKQSDSNLKKENNS